MVSNKVQLLYNDDILGFTKLLANYKGELYMEMKTELIAPCGMNCRLCYGYIRPKDNCSGCNSQDGSKPVYCTKCKIVLCEKRIQNKWPTCALCETPCRRLKDLDKRYRSRYHMSMMENLAYIRNSGIDAFLQSQEEHFRCKACGEILSIHRKECPHCKKPAWE